MLSRPILKIVKSLSYDPWYNLALEENLFYDVKDNEVLLYLWQNKNTVVIGRNQNPWRECRYKELEEDGGKLARRLSGGGAVYHDLGNLNFTFIMKENLFSIEKQLKIIINAVNKLGIKAEFSGRNDIVTDEKKFSGNAFYYDKDRCYHHGTLLVSADMIKLAQYLNVSKEKIKSKGIKSVKSRVVNLKDINPELTIEKLSQALIESFAEKYYASIEETIVKSFDESKDELKSIYEKYSSWQWRYGQTPNFQIEFHTRFDFGDIEFLFNLKDSYVNEVQVYSDAMNPKLVLDMKKELQGVKFTNESIISKLDQLKDKYGNEIILEIQKWIAEK
ncbi:lipoate--protein ligase [Clostridium sp. DL1XJH146]